MKTLKAEEILKIIDTYNLMVRKIPTIIYSSYTSESHDKNLNFIGKVILQAEDFGIHEQNKIDYFNKNFPNGRTFYRYKRIPANAGYYMVKQNNDTGSTVIWNSKKDFLASTLEKSILLFLDSIN